MKKLFIIPLIVFMTVLCIFGTVFAEKIIIEGDVRYLGNDEMLSGSIRAVPVMKRNSLGSYVLPRTASDDVCLDDGTTCLSAAVYVTTDLDLTENYVIRGDSTNKATATDSMVILSSGNVGIGDTSPDAKLEVAVTATATDGYLMVSSAAANDGDIFKIDENGDVHIYNDFYTPLAGAWYFKDSGHEVKYDSVYDTIRVAGWRGQSIYSKGHGQFLAAIYDDAGTDKYAVFDTDFFGIGTTTPLYKLEVDGTVRIDDNLIIGNTTGESGFIGEGDIFASDSIKANGGFYAETQKYGAGLEILNNGNVNIYTNVIYRDATLTASTQTITDTHASYDDSYIGDFLLVFSSTPSYTGAVGEITDVLDSTHLVLSFATSNGDTIVDATAMSYVIYERPIFFAGDNGYVTATIGNSPDAEFKIDIPEGKGFTGVFIDDVAGVDQHQGLTVDVDAQGYDGIVGLNLFMENSSTTNPSVGVTEIMASFEGDGTNYSSSELRFMDFNLLGSGAGNDVDIIHINGLPLTGHILHSGNAESLLAGYYDDGAGTTASTTDAFNSASTDVTLFENNNAIVYVAGATSSEFTNIAFSLSTIGNKNIVAEYYYCDGDDSWKVLPGVVDTTNGFKTSGSINFTNPADRGTCNEEIDSTAFPDTELRPYIAIKRTRSAYPGQKPIESLVSISGGTDYLYMDSYGLKPVPSAGAPYPCSAAAAGMTYYDSTSISLLWCTGSAWTEFAETADITVHNNLSGLQGGQATEYYHFNSSEYTELNGWLDDVILGSNGDLTVPNLTVTATTTFNTVGYKFPATDGSSGQVLTTDSNGQLTWTTPAGGGTVTSVAMTVPTGLTVSGSPITGAGTLAVSLTAGYNIPTTASTTDWNNYHDWRAPTFTASSTTLRSTGTTTIPLGVASCPPNIDCTQNWMNAKCYTTAGTADITCGDGTTFSSLFSVSTATSTSAINYTFQKDDKRQCQVGNLSSIGWLTCTFDLLH